MKINNCDVSQFKIQCNAENETLKTAMAELNYYMKKVFGEAYTNSPDNPYSIVLGKYNEYPRKIHLEKVKNDDGFIIQSYGKTLVICGKTDVGTLYGTYYFIEKYLGVDWISKDVEIYEKPHSISRANIVYDFKLFLRFCHSYNGFDEKFRVRNRLNYTVGDINDVPAYGGVHGIKYAFSWGLFGHTFEVLLPYEEYYVSHPEYYSFSPNRMGENHRYQICLTNPEVLEIVTNNAMAYLEKHPDCKVISISQNDSYFDFMDNYCVCDKCKSIFQKDGNYSAVLLQFVNKVARKIAKKYPNVYVHTFAYHFTEEPPRTIQPEKNVIVQFCLHLPTGYSLTDNDPISLREKSKIDGWFNITDKIFVWTYICDHGFYFAPIGNFRTLYENTTYFLQKGIFGLFQQENSDYNCCEFSELRSYLTAKLINEPNMSYFDYVNYLQKFLYGYYGKGGKYIHKYILLLDEKYKWIDFSQMSSEDRIKFFADGEFIKKGKQLFARAERMAESGVYVERIQKCRKQLEFCELCLMYVNATTPKRKNLYSEKYKTFLENLKNYGIVNYRENNKIPDLRRVDYSKDPFTLSQADKTIELKNGIESEWNYSDDNTSTEDYGYKYDFKVKAEKDKLCNNDNIADWAQDCVEIYLSEDFNRTAKRGQHDTTFRFNADGKYFVYGDINKVLNCKTEKNENGYTVFVELQLENQVKHGDKFGFEIMAHDFSKEGKYISTSYWNAIKGSDVPTHPYYYGILKIK